MWKALRFVESFKKGRRKLGPEYAKQLIEKIRDMAKKNHIDDVFEEVVVLSDLGENLNGIVFVKYDDVNDYFLSGVFRENFIRHDVIREQEVVNIKNHAQQKSVKIHNFIVGNVVKVMDGVYKDTVGRITELGDYHAMVSVRLFGGEHQIQEQFENLQIEDL